MVVCPKVPERLTGSVALAVGVKEVAQAHAFLPVDCKPQPGLMEDQLGVELRHNV